MVLPKYQFILTGAYQMKWDINFGLNYVMRQGYATPFFQSQAHRAAPTRSARPARACCSSRTPATTACRTCTRSTSASTRRSESSSFTANFDVDVFNLFNTATILAKQLDLELPAAFNGGARDHEPAHHQTRTSGPVLERSIV